MPSRAPTSPAGLPHLRRGRGPALSLDRSTLFNEPFATLLLSGHEAAWPPHHHGMDGFVGLLRNILPPVAEASRRLRVLLADATHLRTDSCEGHAGLDPAGEAFAAVCDDRRFFAIDAMLGRAGDRSRPFVAEVCAEYHRHLGLPTILGETNLRGSTSDRATFLKHALDQCEQARAAGVPLDGFCSFGLLDSPDWSSLLEHCRGDIIPSASSRSTRT